MGQRVSWVRRTAPAIGAALIVAVLAGIWLNSGGKSSQTRTIAALETLIGRDFSALRVYSDMGESVPSSADLAVQSKGWLDYHNINSWHPAGGTRVCYRWADIAAGSYDAWWSGQARNIGAWGYPLYLSFTHEPSVNSAIHPSCGTPAEYRAAYDHLVQLFAAQNVTNVTWVWTLTASTFNGGSGGPAAWEPSRYDVVGVDGYNHASYWRTPQAIFQAAEAFARSRGKPLLVGEIGSDEQSGNPNGKAVWIGQAAMLFRSYGDVGAVMWTNTGNGGNYWLDSSPQTLAAFRTAGQGSFYGPRSNTFVSGGTLWGIYSRQ